jgi:L,D-transpeptidase ErfK/SrfK
MLRLALLFLLFSVPMEEALAGGVYPYDRETGIVGFLLSYRVEGEETLHEVARRFNLGYNEITAANPEVNPWLPGEGNRVVVPTKWLLPNGIRKGIVINLAEMRLYQYMRLNGRKRVKTYPIGIGVDGSNTPTGTYRITQKLENPAWYVPKSVRKEKPELPAVVPPGDENPLGTHAMRLSGTDYFIHGTNRAFGIGRRVSHGCIRLYPEDIPLLFESIRADTLVNIVYQPIKIGVREDTLYVEVHDDYLGLMGEPLGEAIKLLKKHRLLGRVDKEQLRRVVAEKKGIPVPLKTP